jgi:hypothetical protein
MVTLLALTLVGSLLITTIDATPTNIDRLEFPRQFTREYQSSCDESNRLSHRPKLMRANRCFSKELYDLENSRVKVQEWSPDNPQWTMTTYLFADFIYRYSVDQISGRLQCLSYPESFRMPRMEPNRYVRTEFLPTGGLMADVYMDSSTGRWLGSREPTGLGTNRTMKLTLYDRFDSQVDPMEFNLPRHVKCVPDTYGGGQVILK